MELLGISRGSAYYAQRPVPDSDLTLMRRIDELHLGYPFMGARLLRDTLNREGFRVGRRHVATLMARMGIEALYRRPRTSQKHPAHKVYSYLLRGLTITRPNAVWALDITDVPMARGFVYRCVVLDWASRKALAHRVSITMDANFCVEALEEALRRYGQPDIVKYRPRLPVHQRGVHRGASGPEYPHQHGRQGLLARQRLRRAPLADGEIRGGLPQNLRLGPRCPRIHRAIPGFL